MTTDERLDRLTERTSGFSGESAVADGGCAESGGLHKGASGVDKGTTPSMNELRQSTRELAQSAKEHDRILRGHADLVGDLARVASAHEQRIQRLGAARLT